MDLLAARCQLDMNDRTALTSHEECGPALVTGPRLFQKCVVVRSKAAAEVKMALVTNKSLIGCASHCSSHPQRRAFGFERHTILHVVGLVRQCRWQIHDSWQVGHAGMLAIVLESS
nr:hypothetical protein CFP56_21200 [Quercus suber]